MSKTRLLDAALFGALSAVGMTLLLWLMNPAPWEVVGFAGVMGFNAARLAGER